MDVNKIYLGNCIDILKYFPYRRINCCITNPPYYRLNYYDVDGQIGNESTEKGYIELYSRESNK